MAFKFIVFITLSYYVYSLDNLLNNFTFISNKTQVKKYVDENYDKIKNSKDYLNTTLYFLIETSNTKVLEELLERLYTDKVEFKVLLNQLVTSKILQLNKLNEEFSKLDKSTFLVVSPAFSYSEDDYNVNLIILFSHRHNAPGCSEVDNPFSILYNNNFTFHFSGNCTLGDEELYFNLELNFFDQVHQIERMDISRGKAHVRISKEKKYKWEQLLRKGEEIPNNMVKLY